MGFKLHIHQYLKFLKYFLISEDYKFFISLGISLDNLYQKFF